MIPQRGRVLVIVYGHVADTLVSVPALRSLRRALPRARLEVLCLRSVAPVLRGCPYVDELVAWDDFKRKHGRRARLEKAAQLARLGVRLRARRYDAALVLHRSFRALRRLAVLSGAAVTAGVSDGGDGYSHPASPAAGGVESPREENRRVLRALGIEEDGGPLELWPTPEERTAARRLVGEAHPLIGLHPGSDWSCQQWLPARFAAVGVALQRAGARVVITGSAAERRLQEEIAAGLDEEPVRCAGRTSLGELVAVIQQLDMLVCVNSAAAAIARAVGTPAVLLLGPEDPRLLGLTGGERVQVLQAGSRLQPGSWCELGRWGVLSGCESPICRGLGGLDQLHTEAVVQAALALLGSYASTRSGSLSA